MTKVLNSFEFTIIYTFLLSIAVTLFTVAYIHEASFVPLFNPTIGVVFGLYLYYGRKVLPSLVSGFLIGHIVMYLFIDVREVPFAIVSGLVFSVILTIELVMGYTLVKRFIPEVSYRSMRFKHALFLYSIAALMGFLAASTASFIYFFIGSFSVDFSRIFSTVMVSHFLSVMTLTPLLFLAAPDLTKPVPWRQKLRCAAFIGLFFITIFYMLQDTSTFIFYRHNYILVVFYILAATWFSYFTQIIMTAGLLLISAFWYVNPAWSVETFYIENYTLLGLAHIAVALSIIIKWFLDTRKKTSRALKTTNENLESTLNYVQTILGLSKDIVSETNDETLAEKTYGLIGSVFEDADAIFSYQSRQGVFQDFKSDRYEDGDIPWLYDLHDDEVFQRQNVYVIHDISKSLQDRYGTAYVNMHKNSAGVKARIYLTFRFSPKDWLVVGLDYFRALTADDSEQIERMRQLTTLLNRLFAKHFNLSQAIRLKKDIILTLVRTLDLYDKYTKGHSETVANIAKRIAEAMDVEADTLNDIYWAGILHDIGKLGVDHDVLNSDKRLDDEEYETIKTHVDKGYSLLKDSESLRTIGQIMRDHHERVDGKGYPQGLDEASISLGGKILSVADAIATMASDRPYQPRKAKEAIIAELERFKGTQFSPDVADTAVRLIKKDALI